MRQASRRDAIAFPRAAAGLDCPAAGHDNLVNPPFFISAPVGGGVLSASPLPGRKNFISPEDPRAPRCSARGHLCLAPAGAKTSKRPPRIFVPQGQTTIARCFSAGCPDTGEPSPAGTADSVPEAQSQWGLTYDRQPIQGVPKLHETPRQTGRGSPGTLRGFPKAASTEPRSVRTRHVYSNADASKPLKLR